MVMVGGLMASSAQAAPVLGASVFATGGHVIATFESNGAGFSNDLFLDTPANGLGLIFNNWGLRRARRWTSVSSRRAPS